MQISLFIYIIFIYTVLCRKFKVKTGFVYEETMDAKSLYERLKSDKIKNVDLYALCLYSPKFDERHKGELHSMEKVGDKITFRFIFNYRSNSKKKSSIESKTQLDKNILMLYYFTTHDNPYETFEVLGMISVKDYNQPIPSTNLEPWLIELYSPFWMVDAAGEELFYTRKVLDSVLGDVLVAKVVETEKIAASLDHSQISNALDMEYNRKSCIMGKEFENSDEFSLINLYRTGFKNIVWNNEPMSNVKMIDTYYYEQLESSIKIVLKNSELINILNNLKGLLPPTRIDGKISNTNNFTTKHTKIIEIMFLEKYCSYIDDVSYMQAIFKQKKRDMKMEITICANYKKFLNSEISVKKCIIVYYEEDQGQYSEKPVDLFLEINSRELYTRTKSAMNYYNLGYVYQEKFDENVVITYKGGKTYYFHKIQDKKVTIYDVKLYSTIQNTSAQFLAQYREN